MSENRHVEKDMTRPRSAEELEWLSRHTMTRAQVEELLRQRAEEAAAAMPGLRGSAGHCDGQRYRGRGE